MEMKIMREVLRRCHEPCLSQVFTSVRGSLVPCRRHHTTGGCLLRSRNVGFENVLLRTVFPLSTRADLVLSTHSFRRSSNVSLSPLCKICSPQHRLLPPEFSSEWWGRRRYCSSASGGSRSGEPGGQGSSVEAEAPKDPSASSVVLSFEQGLPHLTVPLPSRRELCRFPLRPVTHTVDTLVKHLQTEDKGIDRVLVRTTDGVRIASSASIESLLLADFDLVINDVVHRVSVPPQARSTTEELTDLSDVRQLVNKLYAALHVDEHQVARERDILQEIEEIRTQLIPLEKQRTKLVSAAERRTTVLMYCGLGYMALQFGFLARLTWWEYSWDIMEPVTYFVTYGTAIACYAYYVLTKHDFLLPEVRDRQFLLGFHRKAKKTGMDVSHYNKLKDRLFALESDLRRLRDPLALNLPPERLAKIIAEDASQNPLKTSTFSALQEQIKSLLKMRH